MHKLATQGSPTFAATTTRLGVRRRPAAAGIDLPPPPPLLRRFPGSFGRGALFQSDQATGDARISGMAASLCGIEAALEPSDGSSDPGGLTAAAVRRLESMYAIAFSFGGIPLIYMGDELAVRSDPRWAADPAHAHDNRWMHRPLMDWDLARRRHDPDSLEGRVFGAIRRLADARRSLLALRAGAAPRSCRPRTAACCPIAGRTRAVRRSSLLTNFSDIPQSADAGIIARAGLAPFHVHSSACAAHIRGGRIDLPPWGFVWLSGT